MLILAQRLTDSSGDDPDVTDTIMDIDEANAALEKSRGSALLARPRWRSSRSCTTITEP